MFCMYPYHRSTLSHNTYTSQEPAAGLGADLWARGPADLKIGEGIHLCMSYHIHVLYMIYSKVETKSTFENVFQSIRVIHV